MVYIYVHYPSKFHLFTSYDTIAIYICVATTVMSDLAVKPQMDPSLAPITMANFHRFDDVAHIGIRLRIGNHHYTVCINSLII